MGIPFYFATLIKAHSGIVQTIKKDMPRNVDVLCIDFNCLIHRYLKDEDPINSVIDALDHIVKNTCSTKKLIIAMDGLVPYGKIVQQRYRRMCKKDSLGSFDRNQISPGTPYMRELSEELKLRFPQARVSDTFEPGEGEHKIILELKKLSDSERRSVCIYGLDADLILICLQHNKLSTQESILLLRESAEFNDPKLKEAEFASLNIKNLLLQLPIDIRQYIALSIMCFGNDFMPNLAMFSLRESGYDRALQIYQKCKRPDLMTIEGRKVFLNCAAVDEQGVLKERILLRKRPEEKGLLGKDQKLFKKKFNLHILNNSNIEKVTQSYWKTFSWTLEYFITSLPPNWDWVYSYPDAPLISDIVRFPETLTLDRPPLNYSITDQLQFIMPRLSLRKAKKIVKFVDEQYDETRNPWMKKFDWEMKPMISLPWNPTYSLTSVSRL
jgi:5'-3' exonuclease